MGGEGGEVIVVRAVRRVVRVMRRWCYGWHGGVVAWWHGCMVAYGGGIWWWHGGLTGRTFRHVKPPDRGHRAVDPAARRLNECMGRGEEAGEECEHERGVAHPPLTPILPPTTLTLTLTLPLPLPPHTLHTLQHTLHTLHTQHGHGWSRSPGCRDGRSSR